MGSCKKVIIIVDHPNRDLRGLLLIAMELASRGIEVLLSPHNVSGFELWKHRPNLVILNYLRTNNEQLALDLIKANIDFCVLDTEGGVFENYDVFIRSLTKNREVLDNCAGYLAWGRKIQEVLKQNDIFRPDRIFLTGQPRMDFYHSSFSSVLSSLHKESANYKGYFLVNGTFSFSKPRFSTPEKEFQQVTSLFGLTEDYANRMLNYEREVYPKLMALIRQLAQDFPENKIIYRPHPFENPEEAISNLGGFRNVEVNNQGSVDGWLNKSEALIQLNCSTAFEANFLGRPVLLPMFLGEPFGDARIKSVSHLVQSYSELKGILANIKSYQRPESNEVEWKKIVEEIYCANDGKSFFRCANAVEEILKSTKKNEPNLKVIKKISCRPDTSDRNKIKSRLKGFLALAGLSRFFKFGDEKFIEQKAVGKWRKSSKYFDGEMIDPLVCQLKAVNKSWGSVCILKPVEMSSDRSVSVILSKCEK